MQTGGSENQDTRVVEPVGISAAKSQFPIAARQIASDLGIRRTDLSSNDTGPDEFLLDAMGSTPLGDLSFTFLVSYKDKHARMSGRDPYVLATLAIDYGQQKRWSFSENITSMVSHPNYLLRWAGWAVHNFNLESNPLDLKAIVGDNAIQVYGGDRMNESLTQFELLLQGLKVSGSKVPILRLRHVSASIWYRSYSYAVWAQVRGSAGVWVFFYNLGGLDSGGWFGQYKTVEQMIDSLEKNASTKNFDIRHEDFINFLLRNDNAFLRSIGMDSLEPKSIYSLISLDKPFSNSKIGVDAVGEYSKAESSYLDEDFSGSLRDLRAAVQEALMFSLQQQGISISKKDPDIPYLAGLLIGNGKLDGKLDPWFHALTSFSNLSSHGAYPTREQLEEPRIRMRVLGTFAMGRQLLREIEYAAPMSPTKGQSLTNPSKGTPPSDNPSKC